MSRRLYSLHVHNPDPKKEEQIKMFLSKLTRDILEGEKRKKNIEYFNIVYKF